jgi:hypothetical protein
MIRLAARLLTFHRPAKPTPAPSVPAVKPGAFVIRANVPYQLAPDGTWARVLFAPLGRPDDAPSDRKGVVTLITRRQLRQQRKARAQLPGALIIDTDVDAKIDEDGVARPVTNESCPRRVPLSAQPEKRLPPNVMNIGGQPHQMLPDGTWRRIVAVPGLSGQPARPAAPAPPPTPKPAFALLPGTFTSDGRLMRHMDGAWRLVDLDLFPPVKVDGKDQDAEADKEREVVWDDKEPACDTSTTTATPAHACAPECAKDSTSVALPPAIPTTPAADILPVPPVPIELDIAPAAASMTNTTTTTTTITTAATSPAPAPYSHSPPAKPHSENPATAPMTTDKKKRTGTRRHRGRRALSEQEIQRRVEDEVQRRMGQMNVAGPMVPPPTGSMGPVMGMGAAQCGMVVQGYQGYQGYPGGYYPAQGYFPGAGQAGGYWVPPQ